MKQVTTRVFDEWQGKPLDEILCECRDLVEDPDYPEMDPEELLDVFRRVRDEIGVWSEGFVAGLALAPPISGGAVGGAD